MDGQTDGRPANISLSRPVVGGERLMKWKTWVTVAH